MLGSESFKNLRHQTAGADKTHVNTNGKSASAQASFSIGNFFSGLFSNGSSGKTEVTGVIGCSLFSTINGHGNGAGGVTSGGETILGGGGFSGGSGGCSGGGGMSLA